MRTNPKMKYCQGCRQNFYNGNNKLGIKECWHLSNAKIVTRYRIHWWTAPIKPGAFTKVRTLNCHHEPGQFAFYKELPANAMKPRKQIQRRAN